jgi:hypothetical protein
VQLTHEAISLINCGESNLNYDPVWDFYALLQLAFLTQPHFTIVILTFLEWHLKLISHFVYLTP